MAIKTHSTEGLQDPPPLLDEEEDEEDEEAEQRFGKEVLETVP